ncbi:hypothetical protein [Streptomyces sp. NPDC001480]|uniref:hypothetical protein n=1 Tax=Streptomyces sp. NPDC001480 TaxID=3364577 RepID=UPI0036A4033E
MRSTRTQRYAIQLTLNGGRRVRAPCGHKKRRCEIARLSAELLDRRADRFPAPTRAIAQGFFDPAPIDPLDFALHRVLDGVQLLIDRAATTLGPPADRSDP